MQDWEIFKWDMTRNKRIYGDSDNSIYRILDFMESFRSQAELAQLQKIENKAFTKVRISIEWS